MLTVRLSHRLAGLAALAVPLLVLAPVSAARAAGEVPVPVTSFDVRGVGQVGPADRDLMVQVRLAALWEIDAGNLAQRRAGDPRVRRIGQAVAAHHVVLDRLGREAARRLGISLPDQPNTDQLGWLAEMRGARSTAAFDQIFVNRLRAAAGEIFPAVATVRDATRNDAVRLFAQQANQVLMTQMTLLESSGIVDFGALPPAPDPVAAGNGPVPVDTQLIDAARGSGFDTRIALLILAGAALIGAAAAIHVVRSRSRHRSRPAGR